MTAKRPRRRAKGGGRKPRGRFVNKASTLTTRITSSTRQALEAACPRRMSLSQFAEEMLIDGLTEYGRRHRPDAARALGYAIGLLADTVCGATFSGPGPLDWRTNPFAARALALSVQRLMEGIAPGGDVVPPADNERPFLGPCDSPEARAAYAAQIVLHLLQTAPPVEKVSFIQDDATMPLADGTAVGIRKEDASLTPLSLLSPTPMPGSALHALSNTQIMLAQAARALMPGKKS
jgi:hypothetical protein